MGFLANLGSNIGSVVNRFGSFAGNLLGIPQDITGGTPGGNVYSQPYSSQTYSTIGSKGSTRTDLPYLPPSSSVRTSVGNFQTNAMGQPTAISQYGGQPISLPTSLPSYSTQGAPSIRSIMPSGGTPQFSQQSSPQPSQPSATPYKPQSGTSGTSGQASSQFEPFNPNNFQAGGVINSVLGGQPGTSSFTGLLGAAGGLGQSNIAPQGETEQQRQQREQIINSQVKPGQTTPVVINPNQPTITPTGQVQPSVNNQYFQAGPQKQFQAPTLGPSIDVAGIQNRLTQITKLVSLPNVSSQDVAGYMDEVNKMAGQIKLEIDRQNPTPPQPVVETPDQSNFLNQFPKTEQTTVRQRMDELRTQIGLPGLEAQKIDLMKQQQAINTLYKQVVDDVQNNPELPKGLAARRITELNKQFSITLSNLTGQLGVVDQQIQQGNDILDREFQISSAEANQQNQQQDNARANLQMLISSGAIGGLNPDDAQAWASATGIPASAIQAMSQAVKNNAEKYSQFSTQTNDAGTVTILGIKKDGTVDVVKSIKGIGNAQNPTQPTASDRKTQAVVSLYGSTVDQVLQAGLNPQDALAAVLQQAASTGTTLSVEEQNAILQSAQARSGTVTPRSPAATPAPSAGLGEQFGALGQIATEGIKQVGGAVGGFFSRLFGR